MFCDELLSPLWRIGPGVDNVFKMRVSSSQHFLYSEKLKWSVGLEMARDRFVALLLGQKVFQKRFFWGKMVKGPHHEGSP